MTARPSKVVARPDHLKGEVVGKTLRHERVTEGPSARRASSEPDDVVKLVRQRRAKPCLDPLAKRSVEDDEDALVVGAAADP